jgi:release factor glutamine methyltransferase
MTLSDVIRRGKQELEKSSASFGDSSDHMALIVEVALNWERNQIYQNLSTPLTKEQIDKISDVLSKRIDGDPLQYLSGKAGFWRSIFAVGEGVLIPRPETELLIEVLLRKAGPGQIRVAELGAGSGNIGLSACIERPNWEWFAFELNPQSFAYAEQNHQTLLESHDRYHLIAGDFFKDAAQNGPYHWIVTNPPYVASASIDQLSAEVRREPRLALDGGDDGLSVIRQLAKSSTLLCESGNLLMEIGEDQGKAATEILKQEGFHKVEVFKDKAGHDRAVWGKR